ncbi:MAG: PadR family transcriptional regulator [Gemmatimonadota bacterium]
MPKTLGELEQSILFALLDLEDDEAYGVTVREAIQRRTGRSVSSGAVYTGLDRLREQGLVSSWVGDPTPERGGRRKRLYRLEPEGLEALDRSVRVFRAISDGLLDRLAERVGEARESG